MKTLKYFGMLILSILLFACSKESTSPELTDDTANLNLIKTISSGTYNIELFSTSSALQVGYNKIYLRLKDAQGNPVNNVNFSWKPLMHMMGMEHSAPFSTVAKSANTNAIYEGYIVFQMAGNSTEYWDLEINYSVNNVNYTATETINVGAANRRNLESFTGTDGVNYVLAFVDPMLPAVAVNDMSALLFKTTDMMTYSSVSGFTIAIDPRMPSMGNHSSPNNVNLAQPANDTFYRGKLSLTMTGYWTINLQVINASGNVIRGEAITDVVPSSSLFFDLQF